MRTLLACATAAAVIGAGVAPVAASPYDSVLPPDTVVTGPIDDLINILNELLGPGKREWVLHDVSAPAGTFTITNGPNGRIVTVGTGGAVVSATAVKEREYQGHLTEFRLVLQVAGRTTAISRDLDGEGDVDVVWTG